MNVYLKIHQRTNVATVQAAFMPNALTTGMNADLALLLGITTTSLAIIGMSGLRPRITAPTSTGISRFCPAPLSRYITARPGAAVMTVPLAREMGCRRVDSFLGR